MLVRLAPGTDYPSHRHAGFEELHLLDGELMIDKKGCIPVITSAPKPGASIIASGAKPAAPVLMTSTEDEIL